MLNLQMLYNRVLVKLDESSSVTPGGILLPDEAKRKPQRGTVVKVGPGQIYDQVRECDPDTGGNRPVYKPMHVKPGDRVLFSSYAGVDIGEIPEMKGYLLLSEQDIAAVEVTDAKK